MERFDLVVFGYTGYTGKFVFEEVYRQSKNEKFTYAVAGRNENKIKKFLSESATILQDENVNKTPVIIADVGNLESLSSLAKQSRVILNCVGPYRFYGENVVKACIENGAHHLDISGEPQYLEQMQLKYHDEAKSKRVYVVGACGFDSIPAEFGVQFLSDLFDGAVNDVEYYLIVTNEKGMKIHYATFESAVYGLAMINELSALRRKLLPKKLPNQKYSVERKPIMFYSDIVKRWCLPFPSSDKSIIYRSQHYLHYEKGLKPVQFANYLAISSLTSTIFTILLAMVFGLLCKFKFGRYLLLRFPSFFTFGMVSTEGASREVIERSKMELTLIGKGWVSKSSVDLEKPNRKIIVSITGPEPGYKSCSIFIVQAAVTILKERLKMPEDGGVYPPLAAFYNTSYMKRIQNNGIHFAKVSDSTIP